MKLVDDIPKVFFDENDVQYQIGQCDCSGACNYPITPLLVREQLSEASERYQTRSFYNIPIGKKYYVCFGSNRLAVLNSSAFKLLSFFNQPRRLKQLPPDWSMEWGKESIHTAIKEMLVLGLLGCEGRPANLERPSTLSVWLHITDRCNLSCSYCYLDRKGQTMSVCTGVAAVRAIFRSTIAHGYSTVRIKYAGGEPTLELPLIAVLHNYARELSQKHEVELQGMVLSNGTLRDSEIFNTLKENDLQLMVSLDGIGWDHNLQRSYSGGRGSFVDVKRTIERARAEAMTPYISVTVTSHNVTAIPRTVAWIMSRELPFGINFYRAHKADGDLKDLMPDNETLVRSLRDSFNVIQNKSPSYQPLGNILDHVNLIAPHAYPCGVGSDYMVIDTKGNVSKCQMTIEQSVATVYDDDPLELIRSDQGGIQNLTVEEKEECRNCQLRHLCAGGCPLLAYRAAGDYDGRSPYCKAYKALYPELIRLEGLRILGKRPERSSVSQRT